MLVKSLKPQMVEMLVFIIRQVSLTNLFSNSNNLLVLCKIKTFYNFKILKMKFLLGPSKDDISSSEYLVNVLNIEVQFHILI